VLRAEPGFFDVWQLVLVMSFFSFPWDT